MEFLYSAILGIIQGLTEFWPISSSGHLLIAHEIFNFEFVSNLSFDVALHLGTLLALVIFFWSDLTKYIVAWLKSLANFDVSHDPDQRIAWFIVIGTVPAAVVGFFLEDIIVATFRNLWVVSIMLITVGILFIVAEKIFSKIKSIEELGWSAPIVIGVAQALSLVPGVSRSGITILSGMALGLTRKSAARFSFLLSIPVVFGAGLKKMYDVSAVGLAGDEWAMMLVGFVSAAIVGYMAVKFLMKFVENHTLNSFAYYRIVVGFIIMAYLLAG
ncbi:undecaprenyl-diphosphatase UppP [Patescibacteria group bacterium]|nr:undecaprenyl-diphosphatase UppP [Patescibacteria group bacterium]